MRARMRRADKAIVYEAHVKRRMNQRGISTDQVERSVRSPDQERRATREGAIRFEKRLSNRRRLAVIADEESTLIRVVTAFWM